MSLSTPTLRNVGKLLSPLGADTHVFLEIHPCQDLQLLESVALDIGTPPGLCVVADATSFILLEQADFDACIAGVMVSTLDADTSEWVRSRADDAAHEWYGCVTEVALPGEGKMPTIVLGHYPREQAEAIAEAISPKADIFVLNPKQVLISHAAGDLYHYQLRVPGDDEDTVLFVRAVDCDTGLEYAINHLRTARALEPGSDICGINTGLVARVA